MQLPTLISYRRSISPSPALFYAITFDGEKVPIEVKTHGKRGAISDYKAGHGEKDVNLGEWLPFTQDLCTLPHNSNQLLIEFSLKILPNSLKAEACNDNQWMDILSELANSYTKKKGYLYQAQCQIESILLGLPFWRNNDAERMSITVQNISDKTPNYIFDDLPCAASNLSDEMRDNFDELTELVASTLSGERPRLRLRVSALLRKDILEELHPSQEFVQRPTSHKKEFLHKLKKYQNTRQYAVYKHGEVQQALLTSTKINAGMRRDLWISSGDVVAASNYGFNPRERIALRTKSNKKDFFSLIKNINDHIKLLNKLDSDVFAAENKHCLNDIHFIMAILIKGGVFNRETSKNKSDSSEINLSNP